MVVKTVTVLFMLLMLFSIGCTPYSSKFSCPASYNGVCESMQDAYEDSVTGIDPREFDEEYQQKKQAWNETHKELVEARKQARQLEAQGEDLNYRKAVFEELKEVIKRPETPILIPPKVYRALVLGYGQGKMFTAPHHIYFILDEPKWTLKKIPEMTISVGKKIQELSKPKEPAVISQEIQETDEGVDFN